MPDAATQRSIDRLRRLGARERIAACASALGLCDEQEREALAGALLDLVVEGLSDPPPTLLARLSPRRLRQRRRAEEALWALAERWDRLTPPMRAAAVASATGLLPSLADRLARHEASDRRRAAPLIARDWLSPLTISATARLVYDPEERVAVEAERTLLEAVRQRSALGEAGDEALDVALAQAASRYAEHRRRGVMYAAAIGAEAPGPHLAAWLEREDEPTHMALRAAVRKAEDPEIRGRCVAWLGREAIAPAAIDRLERPASALEHADTMVRAHLLLAPTRRRRLGRTRRAERYLPAGDVWRGMTSEARRGGVHWIDALPLRARDRAALFGESLADEDVGVRARAVRRLADLVGRGFDAEALPLLRDYAFDPDERVAAFAASASLDAVDRPGEPRAEGAEEASFRASLRRSPHALVRRLIGEDDVEAGPWRDPDNAVEQAMAKGASCDTLPAKRWSDRDRERVVARLRGEASGENAERRVRALIVCAALNLEAALEVEILAASDDADPRVAATSARLLARLKGEAPAGALERALRHADARVRANAVEGALSSSGGERVDLRRRLADASARVRSIAASALLEEKVDDAEGFEALVALLRDEAPAARCAGLWAVERVGATRLADRVADLTRSDPDTGVRTRARRAARALLGRMSSQTFTPNTPPSEGGA